MTFEQQENFSRELRGRKRDIIGLVGSKGEQRGGNKLVKGCNKKGHVVTGPLEMQIVS